MTTVTEDSRLSNVEGRTAEQSQAIQDLREGQRQAGSDMAAGFREVNARIDQTNTRIDQTNAEMAAGFREVNARIDQTDAEMAAGFREVNARIDQTNDRIDRVFLAMLGIGATLIGLQITQVIVLLIRD